MPLNGDRGRIRYFSAAGASPYEIELVGVVCGVRCAGSALVSLSPHGRIYEYLAGSARRQLLKA